MPYVIIATTLVSDGPRGIIYGPTVVGDQHSDAMLMGQIGATVTKIVGYNFFQFTVEELPREVLNKLEKLGYKVVGMTGNFPEWAWTMYKPDDSPNQSQPAPAPAQAAVTTPDIGERVSQQ